MPTYTYKCTACGETFDRVLKLADYKEPQSCDCGAPAEKQLCAPAVRGDYSGYSCPVTGKWIEGRKAHQENLRRQGCRVLEPGETEAVKRYRAQEETALDKSVEATAEQFVAGLSPQKMEKLASEIQSGVTATVVRQ